MLAGGRGESLTGQTLGPYEIVEELGAGGMGVVYRARGTKLGRGVALKLLLPEYTRDADRLRRFEREARHASSLNHPNIITVYEIGSEGGTYFIVTELVEGETLRRRLAHGPMPISEALGVAAQVADALLAVLCAATLSLFTHFAYGRYFAGGGEAGERGKALSIFRRLEKGKEYVSPGELAILYAALGERERAFASLERAYTTHDLQLQYLGTDPAYDDLRADPRFADLLRRIGLSQPPPPSRA
jgi:hypothetical protein